MLIQIIVQPLEKSIGFECAAVYITSYLGNCYKYSDEKIDEAKSIKKEIKEMDEIEFDPSTIMATVHPNAVYTSRLLEFTDLPQPVNSNKVTIIGNNNGN